MAGLHPLSCLEFTSFAAAIVTKVTPVDFAKGVAKLAKIGMIKPAGAILKPTKRGHSTILTGFT